jgi:DHA1 family bicyclomycin/chloramphenicol resistance-like MFS transporter
MFAYISGSPSVFIDQLGTPPTLYSVFFGLNASGLILLAQRNRALLLKHAPQRIALVGVGILVAAASLLVLLGWTLPRIWTVEPCLYVYVATLGIVSANAAALALEQQAERAGLASALLGTLQFALSALASAAVVHFADGTPVPMASVMLVCALAAGLLGTVLPN